MKNFHLIFLCLSKYDRLAQKPCYSFRKNLKMQMFLVIVLYLKSWNDSLFSTCPKARNASANTHTHTHNTPSPVNSTTLCKSRKKPNIVLGNNQKKSIKIQRNRHLANEHHQTMSSTRCHQWMRKSDWKSVKIKVLIYRITTKVYRLVGWLKEKRCLSDKNGRNIKE